MNPGEPVAAGHLLDGRYRVRRVIGQGGMGRVYLANDTRLASRPVAVKEMVVGEGLQEKKAVEDFEREARVLATLSHPGIPGLFDHFIENGRHYLVMEYVAGSDLQGMLDKLGAGGRLPEAQVVRWARQILEVLAFLHSQKPPIVYRDIKPGNIMIAHNDRAMLIDFGIARFLPPGGHGTQIGSVGYAPPEQYTGKVEARSDLYSLGATMHHLLTGRDPQLEPPFSFPPVRKLNPAVSVETERVVMRALERQIDKRPRSAREMSDALPRFGEEAEAGQMATGQAPRSRSLFSESPTVVLSSSAAVAPQAAPLPPGITRIPTQRTLKAPQASASPSVAAPSVSATAKTQDLPKKSGAASAPPRRSIAATPRRVSRTPAPAASGATVAPESSLPLAIAPIKGAAAVSKPNAVSPGVRTNGRGQVQGTEAPASARLIAKGERVEFAVRGDRIVIGRRRENEDAADIDIDLSALAGADRVSHRHAEIIRLGREYFMRDLGSLNGTYIPRRGRLGRDQLYQLKDRDELVLGSMRLEFRKG
jgi:serine/threonine protein kinase